MGAMTITERLVLHRDGILRVAADYGARNVRVFGSVARGEAGERSDVDLVVTMEPGRTLFDVGGLAYDLEGLLGLRVDVVTEGALRGVFGERVLRDARRLEDLAA